MKDNTTGTWSFVADQQGSYRHGFNGKEWDNDVKGKGNQYDYGFRIYDPRVARFLSIDPLFKEYPWYTPYQYAGNKPIVAIDIDGLEDIWIIFTYGQIGHTEISYVNIHEVNDNTKANLNSLFGSQMDEFRRQYGDRGVIITTTDATGKPVILQGMPQMPTISERLFDIPFSYESKSWSAGLVAGLSWNQTTFTPSPSAPCVDAGNPTTVTSLNLDATTPNASFSKTWGTGVLKTSDYFPNFSSLIRGTNSSVLQGSINVGLSLAVTGNRMVGNDNLSAGSVGVDVGISPVFSISLSNPWKELFR